MEDKLRGFRKCAETVSKLTKTNKEKVEQLEELKSNSIKARNRLDVLYYDIQTLEEENIRLNEKIKSYLDRQNHAELSKYIACHAGEHTNIAYSVFFKSGFITRNDTAKKQLETFRKELTTLAEFLGLDSNRINLTGNRLEITLPESQQTTLSFEETEGNLERKFR